MSDDLGKLSIRDIRDIIETEGLGNAIKDYLGYGEIQDPTLSKMWKRCSELLIDIENYVNDEEILNNDTLDYEDDDEGYDG